MSGSRAFTRVLLLSAAALGSTHLGCTQLIDSAGATYAAPEREHDELTLQPAVLAGDNRFGAGLALEGDELIVTAPAAALEIESSSDDACDEIVESRGAGRAFAMAWDGKSWQQPAREITRDRADEDDGRYDLGGLPSPIVMGVARSGDLLAIGYPGMDYTSCVTGMDLETSVANVGGVYVYERSSKGGWRRQALITSEVPTANGGFGVALAMRGDDLFVGAPGEDVRGSGTARSSTKDGVVYVYRRDGDTWTMKQRLAAANAAADASFGCALAVDGDTLAIGAFLDSHPERGINPEPGMASGVASGAAYVFRELDGEWIQEAYIKADNPGYNDLFGISIALEGDRLLVGAPVESAAKPLLQATPELLRQTHDDTKEGAGAVYAYERSESGWEFRAYIKAPEPQVGAGFGNAVAVHEGRLLIGATYQGEQENASPDDSGAAYLYDRIAADAVPRMLRPAPEDKRAGAGFSVALGDRWAAIGAPDADDHIGFVRIYDVSR